MEGKFYSPLLKVELNGELEAGEFKGHGKVCQFKVVTKNVPFEVDENGEGIWDVRVEVCLLLLLLCFVVLLLLFLLLFLLLWLLWWMWLLLLWGD